jgi:hypothetical protein
LVSLKDFLFFSTSFCRMRSLVSRDKELGRMVMWCWGQYALDRCSHSSFWSSICICCSVVRPSIVSDKWPKCVPMHVAK